MSGAALAERKPDAAPAHAKPAAPQRLAGPGPGRGPGSLRLAAGNQAATRAAVAKRDETKGTTAAAAAPSSAGAPATTAAEPAGGGGRGNAELHKVLEQSREHAAHFAASVPGAQLHHMGMDGVQERAGVPGGETHKVAPGEHEEGFSWPTLMAPGLAGLGGLVFGGGKLKPSGGVVAAGQVKYNSTSKNWSLTGWVWGGIGFKGPGGIWVGSYGYYEGTMDISPFDFDHHLGPAGLATVPLHKSVTEDPATRAKANQKGKTMKENFALTGIEATFLSSKRSEVLYDVEGIVLVDVLRVFPWFAWVKKVAQFADRLETSSGKALQIGAGINLGVNFTATRGKDHSEGFFGWHADNWTGAGGLHLTVDANLPENKKDLPRGH